MSTVVILGAGLGARLRPHTDDRPKCVVELAGEPLAVRLLRQLSARGVSRATVVVGHFAERAREILTAQVRALRLPLELIVNPEYDRTNTMYSLHLAMPALAEGGFVIEGDIVAGERALDAVVACAGDHASRWAVDAWTTAHSGSQLLTDNDDRIVAQRICRDRKDDDAPPPRGRRRWKSAGMLWLSADGARATAAALARAVAAGQRGVYYDQVLGELLAREPEALELRALDLAGAPWMEIDDAADLAAARAMFEAPSQRAAG